MIRTLIICSTLVFASGASAVALAVLHDQTSPQVARLAPQSSESATHEGFVLPSFAPASRAVDTPTVVDNAPVAVEGALVDEPLPAHANIRPMMRPEVTSEPAVRPQVIRNRTVVAPAQPFAEPVQSTSRSKSRPMIVAQAPAFGEFALRAAEPDYVIGVYR